MLFYLETKVISSEMIYYQNGYYYVLFIIKDSSIRIL